MSLQCYARPAETGLVECIGATGKTDKMAAHRVPEATSEGRITTLLAALLATKATLLLVAAAIKVALLAAALCDSDAKS